jgi:transposase
MKHVDGLSQRAIRRRTGIHRDTIRKALASSMPPSYGPRPARASKLDPFLGTIEELLADEPTVSGCAYPRGAREARLRIGRLKGTGRAAARSEWRLIAATRNLLKLHRHTLATAAG